MTSDSSQCPFLSGSASTDKLQKKEVQQGSRNLSVERSEDWVKATASKVKVLVEQLCKLVTHDNWRVRLGLVEGCEQLLMSCCRFVLVHAFGSHALKSKPVLSVAVIIFIQPGCILGSFIAPNFLTLKKKNHWNSIDKKGTVTTLPGIKLFNSSCHQGSELANTTFSLKHPGPFMKMKFRNPVKLIYFGKTLGYPGKLVECVINLWLL